MFSSKFFIHNIMGILMHEVTFCTPMFDIPHHIFILEFRHSCHVLNTVLTAREGMGGEHNL